MSLSEIGTLVSNQLGTLSFSFTDLLAYAAGAIGVAFAAAGAIVRTMIPLRWLAVGSNLGLLVFGALHPSLTTFAVSAVLLPINLYRVREMTRLTRKVTAAEVGADLSGVWLRPYMKARKMRAGQVLFRRGDQADMLYLVADGRMELVEIGRELPAGRIFGEIALFSPSKKRTATARCVTPCTVLCIDEGTVKQLYHQNPSFGFHLIALVAARLSEDVQRSQQAASAEAPPSAAALPPEADPS
jgi:hypothetical protein